MNRKTKLLLVICLCLLLTILNLTVISASDVGNSFSGGGGGGSSFSSGGGSGLFMIFGGGGLQGLITLFIFLAIMMYLKNRNSGNVSNGSQTSFDNSYLNEDSVISSIKENDPDFSAEAFKSYAGEVYITLQEAWEAREWRKVRNFESNSLFNMHNSQMQEYLNRKITPHLDMQNVRKITLADYHIDGNTEVLTVRLNASLIDYDTDDKTGKVISGSKTAFQNRSYRLEFIRSLGVKTVTNQSLNTTNCPNCGAPTSVTSSGECEYCGSIITNGEFGWVLNKYAAWQ